MNEENNKIAGNPDAILDKLENGENPALSLLQELRGDIWSSRHLVYECLESLQAVDSPLPHLKNAIYYEPSREARLVSVLWNLSCQLDSLEERLSRWENVLEKAHKMAEIALTGVPDIKKWMETEVSDIFK